VLRSTAHMRAAAILGPGCSAKDLSPFQTDASIDWRIGLTTAPDQADVILLFGGDGTIHRHLSPLVKLGLPVLVVPAGSGNDFARALGLRRVRDSLAAWHRFLATRDNLRTVDLGMITALGDEAGASSHEPRYFCSVAGIGLDAEVARRANSLPRWLRAHGGYALSLGPALFGFAPFPMRILTSTQAGEWQTHGEQPTILAAFANTSTYGDGMKIAPQARMDDGLLDVCVIGALNPIKLACLFPTVYFGRHLTIREVEYFRTSRARVQTDRPLDVYADGEFICRTPVEIGIQPGAMRMIVPPRSDDFKA
jgi:diacylglycerol kinase (ATP)